jgi:tetratricopeptide (TPR) repeat protein
METTGWPDMHDGASALPLWQRHPDDFMWLDVMNDSRTVYLCSRAVANKPEESNEAFFGRAFALADSTHAERVVLDLRENDGGNGFLNRNVVRQIIAHPGFDRPDRFFVIIGRATFSAGQQLVNDLQYFTNATFVGEPTGNAPNQFGDTRPLVLPRSHLVIQVASRWHQGRNASDDARFVAPAMYAPLTATDYRRGVDPALKAILAYPLHRTLAQQLEEPLQAGDSVLVAQRFREYRDDVAHRYAGVEREMNALGYQELSAGRVDAALIVFGLNTQAFPRSANVYDSYGEALVKAGRRAEAVTAFRHALSIDATWSSARAWLRQLKNNRE